MYCKHCGASIVDKARFCPKCGTNIMYNLPLGQNVEIVEVTKEKPKKKKSLFAIVILLVLVVVAIVMRDDLWLFTKNFFTRNQIPKYEEMIVTTDSIFYLDSEGTTISCYDRESGQYSFLVDENSLDLSQNGYGPIKHIFYFDDTILFSAAWALFNLDAERTRISKGNISVYDTVLLESDYRPVYVDPFDLNLYFAYTHRWLEDNSVAHLAAGDDPITEGSVSFYNPLLIHDGWLYATGYTHSDSNGANHIIARVNISDSSLQIIAHDTLVSGDVYVVNEYLYYLNSRDNCLYKVSVDGTGTPIFVEENVCEFVMEDGVIYYIDSTWRNIYRKDSYGSKREKLVETASANISLFDGELYFLDKTKKSATYAVDTDGENLRLIVDQKSIPTSLINFDSAIYGESDF